MYSIQDRWKDYNYRRAVHEAIPHLRTLDDRPADDYSLKSRSASARPQSVRGDRSSSDVGAGGSRSGRQSIASQDSASADGDGHYCEANECPALAVANSDACDSEAADAEGSEFDADWRFISAILEETSVADSGAADLMLTPATTSLSTPLSTAGGSDRRQQVATASDGGSTRLCTAASYRPTTGYRPGSALRPSSAQKRMQLRSVVSAASNATASNVLLQSSFPATPLLTSKSDPVTASLRLATASSTRPPTTASAGAAANAARQLQLEPEEDSASQLTSGDVVCGNPFKALKTRRASPKSPLARHLTATDADARPATAQAIERLPPRLAELIRSKLPQQLLAVAGPNSNAGVSMNRLDELSVESLDEETQKAIWEARVFIEQHKSYALRHVSIPVQCRAVSVLVFVCLYRTRDRIEKARAPQILKIEPDADDAAVGEQVDDADRDSAIERSSSNMHTSSTASTASSTTTSSTTTSSGREGTRTRRKSPARSTDELGASESAAAAAATGTSSARLKSARAPLAPLVLDKRAAMIAARQLLAAKRQQSSSSASASAAAADDAAAASPPASASASEHKPSQAHHHSHTGMSLERTGIRTRDDGF